MVQVKRSRRIIDCMDEHCSDAYDIGGLTNTGERVSKEGLAKPFSLLTLVHSQARNENDALGMVRDSLGNSFRGFVLQH